MKLTEIVSQITKVKWGEVSTTDTC